MTKNAVPSTDGSGSYHQTFVPPDLGDRHVGRFERREHTELDVEVVAREYGLTGGFHADDELLEPRAIAVVPSGVQQKGVARVPGRLGTAHGAECDTGCVGQPICEPEFEPPTRVVEIAFGGRHPQGFSAPTTHMAKNWDPPP
jgi:hypothetical protein